MLVRLISKESQQTINSVSLNSKTVGTQYKALPHTYKKKEEKKICSTLLLATILWRAISFEKRAFPTPLGRPTTLQSLFVYFFHLLFLCKSVVCILFGLGNLGMKII